MNVLDGLNVQATRPGGAGLDQLRHVHFVGIGGSGMCGMAEVLFAKGYRVTGSDIKKSAATERLAQMGVELVHEHRQENIRGADAVIYSGAIPMDSPELEWARKVGVPVISRAEMLGEMMRFSRGITVAGSHGKTTTAALISEIFQTAGLDPTWAIGGLLKSTGSHARHGSGVHFIAEADESDASFIILRPIIAVITNIDRDHLTAFGGSMRRLDKAFAKFLQNVPFHGRAVLCGDDPGVARIIADVACPMVTYGLTDRSDFIAASIEKTAAGSHFRVSRPAPDGDLEIISPLLGQHNVLNVLAAIAVASCEGIHDEHIRAGIRNYSGVERRMDLYPDLHLDGKRLDMFDDYGHHPTEILAVISTLRHTWPGRRLVMVFQPHRYSRTRDLHEEFVAVLSLVDVLIILDVYAAGEEPIAGISARGLCLDVLHKSRLDPFCAANLEEAYVLLRSVSRAEDLLIVQGAGDVDGLKTYVLKEGSNVTR